MAKKLKLFEHLVKLGYKEIEARCAPPTCRHRR
jgi:isopropylmalate/homocitrate/citramalate synthase